MIKLEGLGLGLEMGVYLEKDLVFLLIGKKILVGLFSMPVCRDGILVKWTEYPVIEYLAGDKITYTLRLMNIL